MIVTLRALGFLFVVLAFAQEPEAVVQKPAPNASVAATGKPLFQQNCGFCHGPNARGASGPDLIHSALVSHDLNGDLIGPVVRNGRPEKGMPAFQLADDQIRAIAAFLHEQARLAYTTYQRGPGDYPVEKLLVGNAEAGKKYFFGAGGCSGCHSPSGDLAHIASKFKPVDLQSRIVYPSGADPTVTVTEPSGKIYTGSQVYSDEFTISLRDKHGWIRSWNRQNVKVDVRDPLVAHQRLLSTYTDRDIHDLFAYLETLK